MSQYKKRRCDIATCPLSSTRRTKPCSDVRPVPIISVRASASQHDLVLLGCRRRLLTRRQSVSRCSHTVVSPAIAVGPIACTEVSKCADHCFIPVVPLFDLASCSKYTVYQKSMHLAPPCAWIESYKVVEQIFGHSYKKSRG